MNKQVITLTAGFVLAIAPAVAQLSATQPQPVVVQTQRTPAQVQACLAALPPAPKPPHPPVNLFPGLQQKLDDLVRKAGGDPVAMRKASAEAAVQKYLDAKAAYDQQRIGCSAPIPLPVFPAIPAPSALPNFQPPLPPAPGVPVAPTKPQQPK